ncbi:MAG: FAD-dependent oxidoreductase [Actinomycetales bacterium]|nr:FAD-dependent oxidoreductase [Actinomycetales bacterium]
MSSTVWERRAPSAAAIDAALAPSEPRVFWLDDVDRPERPALRGDREADLVIVGGGYTGLWSAVRAKRRDPERRVILLEAARIGWAASGRNGGFVEASLTHGEENGRRRWPEEYEQLERLGLENLAGFERDLDELGVDADFARAGSLDLAVEEHQLAWLDEAAEDPRLQRLDAAATRALVDSPIALGGLRHPGAEVALVHPGKLALGLAAAAERLGVEVLENSRVRRVENDGAGVRVRTAEGSVRAERALLATNVFPALLARARLMTVPVYDYVLMTEPLDAAQRAAIGWAGREGLADLANQFHYSQITPEGRILFGGYDAVYHPGGRVRARYEERPASHRRLASHLLTLLPQLEGVRITHRWAGAIDTSTRFCAFFGRARGGRVSYAAGFTGLGVGASRFAAEVMLDLADGSSTERTELRMVRERPLPFPPEPAASLGIQATRWSLDRADHAGGRRNLLLRGLDAVGLGFDS